MCPDKQTLSTYSDGEVGWPWREKIDLHVSDCKSCQRTIAFYMSLKNCIAKDDSAEKSAVQQKIWERISYTYRRHSFHKPFWNRRIHLPVPVFGLAAVLLLVLFGLQVFTIAQNQLGTMRITTEPSGLTEVQISAPIKDLEGLLKSLDKNQFQREVQIQLPEESQFQIQGEPMLLRVDDFDWDNPGILESETGGQKFK